MFKKEENDERKERKHDQERLGDEERRLMHLVPAPAVKLMKGRVLSRPGMKKCLHSSLKLDQEYVSRERRSVCKVRTQDPENLGS